MRKGFNRRQALIIFPIPHSAFENFLEKNLRQNIIKKADYGSPGTENRSAYSGFFSFGCLGGGIGRRKGLKIPRCLAPYRFDSGPRHHLE